MNEFAPYTNEREAVEAYEEELDYLHNPVDICGITYSASRALKLVDPIAFQCGFNDWLDSVQRDMEED